MSKMPVLFIGHGSPMNAIEDNEFTRNWSKLAKQLPKPKAILSISAHWYTKGTRINDEIQPKMIYDMYGFPKELYEVKYNAPGSPEMAQLTKSIIGRNIQVDNSWGLDHGTWSVLRVMYPNADIPVYQLSIDRTASAAAHYEIGRELNALRDKGILILGSGNVVHNLPLVDFSMEKGFDWAYEFDEYIKDNIYGRKHQAVIDYKGAGKSSELAFPIPDHYYPLLYVLGASGEDDSISAYNDKCIMGSLSMTCYEFK